MALIIGCLLVFVIVGPIHLVCQIGKALKPRQTGMELRPKDWPPPECS